jgi:hypothetical protein
MRTKFASLLTTAALIRQRMSVVKAGVNYKFDWGTPILAKY